MKLKKDIIKKLQRLGAARCHSLFLVSEEKQKEKTVNEKRYPT